MTDGRTDRRTDGQTDGRAIAYSALSMLSRAKNTIHPALELTRVLLAHKHVNVINNNNNTLIYIAPACRMTSEALK